MNTGRMVFLVVLLVGVASIVGAQESGAENGRLVENQVMGIQAGFAGGYRLNDSEVVVGQTFSLNLTVASNVQVRFGAVRLSGNAITDNYALMKIGYYFAPNLGFDIAVGSAVLDVGGAGTATESVGAGVFYNAFRSAPEGGLSSALKVSLDYLATTEEGFDNGAIALGLSAVFGL